MTIFHKLFKNSFTNNEDINASPIEQHSKTNQKLSGVLAKDIQQVKKIFDHFSDMVYREFKVGGTHNAVIFFLDGFVNSKLINSDVLKPLLNYRKNEFENRKIHFDDMMNFIQSEIISAAQISSGVNLQEILDHVLSGEVILLINGIRQALFIDIKEYEKRSIEESIIEPTIRGPRDGFTEDLRTNICQVRRRLKTSKLKMERMQVGRLSNTNMAICYIEGIADNSVVKEVQKRISKIDIDAVLESGYIEELIEDNHFSVFSQFGYTERPDKLAGSLLEGQIGIIIDNTPIALIAPQTLFQAMTSCEDYYERGFLSSPIRFIRYFYLGLALAAPSFYIALLTFHQGMIPRNLLFAIWISRENVPFPVLVEALMIEIFFEGLREAGIRLPGIAGQTVSIVGAFVIGQAAVQANIVSASMVIVVSITGISSFIIPRYNLALSIRILRFVMMILAGSFGLYGMYMGGVVILIHMAKLRSFGVPYLSPLAPLDLASLKDVFIRAPWWAMNTRPEFINNENIKRKKAH